MITGSCEAHDDNRLVAPNSDGRPAAEGNAIAATLEAAVVVTTTDVALLPRVVETAEFTVSPEDGLVFGARRIIVNVIVRAR